MPCRSPPSKTTEPMSSLILIFRAAASVPDVSWLQAPFPCAHAEGSSTVNNSIPTNCGERFKINPSLYRIFPNHCHTDYCHPEQRICKRSTSAVEGSLPSNRNQRLRKAFQPCTLTCPANQSPATAPASSAPAT